MDKMQHYNILNRDHLIDFNFDENKFNYNLNIF